MSKQKGLSLDEVAKMLRDFSHHSYACECEDISEWLPEVCEIRKQHFGCPDFLDTECWEQYILHVGEKGTILTAFLEKAIDVLKTEKKCVLRNSNDRQCNHDCANCDLVLPAADIVESYDTAIAVLERKLKERKGE